MSQIDEGDLQAYLDGAYEVLSPEQLAEIERLIEEDEAFAAQVDEARATRAAASEILGDAVPKEFAPPPFEELQRRAAAAPATDKPEKRRWIGIPPLVGMGWAATVILALGVGWFVGQGAGDPQFGNFRDAASPASSPRVEAESVDEPGQPSTEERSNFDSQIQGRTTDLDASAPGEALREGLDVPADLVGRTSDDLVAGALEKKADGFAEDAGAESPETVGLDQVTVTGAGAAVDERLQATREVRAEGDVSGPPASELARRRGSAAQEAPPAGVAENEVEPPEAGQRGAEEFAARAREDAGQAERNVGAESGVTRDALMNAPSEEHAYHSLALPGLEVLSVTLDEAGALSGLMILHQLPAGDTLELRYVGLFSQAADPRGGVGLGDRVETEALPALSAQIREAALPPGWRQVVVRKENRWVVARAPISEAQIRAYLMTLN